MVILYKQYSIEISKQNGEGKGKRLRNCKKCLCVCTGLYLGN